MMEVSIIVNFFSNDCLYFLKVGDQASVILEHRFTNNFQFTTVFYSQVSTDGHIINYSARENKKTQVCHFSLPITDKEENMQYHGLS